MRKLIISFCLSAVLGNTFAQSESPYKTSFAADGSIIAGGLGLSVLGLSQIKNKSSLTAAEVLSKSKSDVNGFDRGAAGNYSEKADKQSYYPFYASFAMPVAMLLNDKVGSKSGQVIVMYVETMAITAALFTTAAGNVQRSRPLVYSSSAPMDKRMDKDSQRSFYAGHTAATAAAAFYAAKVFQDFNPDSRAKPYVWATAAALPAVVGYLRLKSGNHFLSDNLLGYAVGATTGILVPQLHKKSNKSNFSLVPVMAPDYKGTLLSYRF